MFTQDLNVAHIAEKHLVQAFQNRNIQAWTNDAPDYQTLKGYDLGFYNNGEWLAEAKLDWYSLHSPNFLIEQQTLEHTKAHYWIHIEPVPWILPVPSVRQLFNNHPLKYGIGEGNVNGVCVKKVTFKEQAKPLWKFVQQLIK